MHKRALNTGLACLQKLITAIGSAIILSAIIIAAFSYNTTKNLQKCVYDYVQNTEFKQNSVFWSQSNQYEDELQSSLYSTFQSNIEIIEQKKNVIKFNLTGEIANFPAIIAKKYPSLFSYERNEFFISSTADMSRNDYYTDIINTLNQELSKQSISDVYKFTIQMTAIKKDGKWVIENHPDFENQLLGNIYSWQNEHCQFLTFKELVFPTDSSMSKTAQTGAISNFAQ